MSNQRISDMMVGLLVIGAVLVLVLAFVFTKGWNKRQWDLYMRAESAQDLSVDTRVYLQYLQIGEVAAIAPQADSMTGRLRFLVHLRIDEQYQDGTPLVLPLGTQAEVVPGSLVGGAAISLRLPEHTVGRLASGDTISSTRKASGLDAIAQTADSLRQQITLVLADTRTLINGLSGTVEVARHELERTGPSIRSTMGELELALADLRPALARADTLMATVNGRVGGLGDSITTAVAEVHRLVANLDTLARTASGIAGDNRALVRTTAENLYVISAKLDHMLDQVSRRPLRMIFGVRPMPGDSLRASFQAGDTVEQRP